jgi:hypothetical protein
LWYPNAIAPGLVDTASKLFQNVSALLGAEVGEEVDVLAGSYVRPAVVEKIIKNGITAI